MYALTIAMTGVAYLMGSINTAVLISRYCKLPDPRQYGSHNPGASNVFRTGKRGVAGAVLLLDMAKGTVPVYLSWYLKVPVIYLGFIGIAACLGHMYPLYFEFRGGKGVATALGALMPLGLDMGCFMIATWVVVLFWSGYSSLAAIVAALVAPLYTYFLKPEYTLPVAMLCCLIILRHHENISRLLHGVEPKIWQRKSKSHVQGNRQ